MPDAEPGAKSQGSSSSFAFWGSWTSLLGNQIYTCWIFGTKFKPMGEQKGVCGLAIYILKIKYLKPKEALLETQIFHHAKIVIFKTILEKKPKSFKIL
jgi:hypothetical protein